MDLSIYNNVLKDMFKDYSNGMSLDELTNKYSISKNSFAFLRKKHNIPAYKKYSDSLMKQAYDDYMVKKIGLKAVCEKYGFKHGVLVRYAKENNLPYKTNRGAKYSFDREYFKNIDSEEKAYWLGFLYADGCVNTSDKTCTSPNRLTINISHRDRIILEKFNQSINGNLEIFDYMPSEETYGNSMMSRLNVNSVEFCEHLINHGCIPNKTFELRMPNINEHLICHFVRGFLDGDGSISGYCISFTKGDVFLKELNELISSILDIEPGHIQYYKNKDSRVCNLKFSKKESCRKIYNWLYDNATIFLERKKNKYTV